MTSKELFFKQLNVGPMDNFHYVFGGAETSTSAIVDPGFEPRHLVKEARSGGREVTHIVLTHGHRDHVASLAAVRDETDADIVAHPDSAINADIDAEDGATLEIAGVDVTCHHTPGHAPDHVAYVVDDSKLLAGDALFIGDCGRVDLPGADIEDMWHTLMETIPSLPGHLEVCPGHDYGPQPTRLLKDELEENFTLEKRELDEFRDFMGVE
jgi:glyoxylase-like metal-dependent hydrolase (beta-lactamase superfamily II)